MYICMKTTQNTKKQLVTTTFEQYSKHPEIQRCRLFDDKDPDFIAWYNPSYFWVV